MGRHQESPGAAAQLLLVVGEDIRRHRLGADASRKRARGREREIIPEGGTGPAEIAGFDASPGKEADEDRCNGAGGRAARARRSRVRAPYERRRGRPAFECPLDTGEGSRFVAKDRSYRTPVKRRISPRGSSARRAGRDGRQAEPGNGITAPVDSWISPMTPSSNPAGRPEARALEAKQNTPWLTDRFRSADDPTNPIGCGFKAHGRACVPCAGAHDAPARG